MRGLERRVATVEASRPVQPPYPERDWSVLSDEDLRFIASLPLVGKNGDLSHYSDAQLEQAEAIMLKLEAATASKAGR